MNQAMLRKLESGEAIDLSKNAREGDDVVLERFVEDVDYCIFNTEQWIWSIGRRLSDGVILASTTTKFYQAEGFDCLWLR